MARRLSVKQIEQIIRSFTNGVSIDDLSLSFNCTKLTIARHLKKKLGEKKYKELVHQNKESTKPILEITNSDIIGNQTEFFKNTYEEKIKKEDFPSSSFTEIIPLNYEFDNASQKDLSSIPITEVDFPKIVYMIVDKKIELEIKSLKDYPEWHFLSQDELNRKTIEIYFDLKNAKRSCGKDQKVIKVPNTEVFKIAAPFLLSRGISRIVSSEKLIAL